jgi:predicted transcriptional regulator
VSFVSLATPNLAQEPLPLQESSSNPFHASGEGEAATTVTRRCGRLGRRELEVLEVVWAEGSGTVQQVSVRLSMRLAYTTVMTTLDRLFKKGLLHRVKRDRAFLYSPAASPAEVECLRARSLIDRFFDGRTAHQDLLLSCLVNVLGQYDDEMLDRLEDKIRSARQELNLAGPQADPAQSNEPTQTESRLIEKERE